MGNSRTKLSLDVNGVLLIDKPYGCSSFDVLRKLKYHFGITKLGHAGTLDPLATGLLVVVLGKATKLSQMLMCNQKEYTGIIQLGIETSTYDAEGEIVSTQSVDGISQEQVQQVMKGFLGDQYQQPPMFSAKKKNGVPLYKLARKGQEVEREPNFITIFSFEMEHFALPNVTFRVKCSKGTYIRSLAYDLGKKVGCGAHLASLRRTRSGSLGIDQAITLDELLEQTTSFLMERLIPCEHFMRSTLA